MKKILSMCIIVAGSFLFAKYQPTTGPGSIYVPPPCKEKKGDYHHPPLRHAFPWMWTE